MFLVLLHIRVCEYKLHLLAFTLFCSHYKIVYFLLYSVNR